MMGSLQVVLSCTDAHSSRAPPPRSSANARCGALKKGHRACCSPAAGRRTGGADDGAPLSPPCPALFGPPLLRMTNERKPGQVLTGRLGGLPSPTSYSASCTLQCLCSSCFPRPALSHLFLDEVCMYS